MTSDASEIDRAYKRVLKDLARARGLAQDSAVSEQAADTAPPSTTEAVSAVPRHPPPIATPPQQPVVVHRAEDVTLNFTGGSSRTEPKRGDEKSGDIIDGRYELEQMLQEGGQGAVWRAKDLKTYRAIAIKLIFQKDNHEERALREPQLLRHLNHENIVEIRDIEIQKEQVSPYIAYEYIEGHDLNHVVHDSMPSIEQAATWCRDIARAMQHAHEQGVLHRDLKPQNVMLQTSTNKIKVIDFGLGKAVHALDNDENSRSGDFSRVGTARWAAPEQFRTKATFATDIYQIGAILYFTLTREAPRDRQSELQADSSQVINSIRRDIGGLPEVPRPLENICLQALKPCAKDRQATAQELADQLDQFLGLNPGFAPQTTTRAKRTLIRRSVEITSLCFVSILLVFATLAMSRRADEARDKQQGFSRLSAADFGVLKGSLSAIQASPFPQLLRTGITEIKPEGISLIELKPTPSEHQNQAIKSFTFSLEMRPLGDPISFGIILASRKLGENHIQQHIIKIDRLPEHEEPSTEEAHFLVATHSLVRLEFAQTDTSESNQSHIGELFYRVPGPIGHKDEIILGPKTDNEWIEISCTVQSNQITSLTIAGVECREIVNDNLLKQWLIRENTEDIAHGFFVWATHDQGYEVRNCKRKYVYER
jgi:serine/threonine protein kinase